MVRTIAIANQKGGVAKTTSAVALGAAIAESGARVLLVDLDPQASLSYSLGLDPDSLDVTIHDVLVGRVPIGKTIHQLAECDVVPSNIDLAGAEAYLLTRTGREYALRTALEDLEMHYNYIIIDCPPSLGVLTITALTTADEVLIPMQCEALSQRGVGQLLDTINDVREFTNPGLRVSGIVATMYDSRTNEGRRVLENVAAQSGLTVLEPPVPRSVRFAEASSKNRSIVDQSPRHAGADAYRRIVEALRAT